MFELKKISVYALILTMATPPFSSFAADLQRPGGHSGDNGGVQGSIGNAPHGSNQPAGGGSKPGSDGKPSNPQQPQKPTQPPATPPTQGGTTPSAPNTPPPVVVPQGPTQDQINAARALGAQEAAVGGRLEANERANVEAKRDGMRNGHENGFNQCMREERERARDLGFRDGFARGQSEGSTSGYQKGQEDGQRRGNSDGIADGQQRANRDAQRSATGPGREKGETEANASDATSRGTADGTSAGNNDALATAQRDDYPRGHQDYRTERENEKIENRDTFNQKAPATQPVAQTTKTKTSMMNSFAQSFMQAFSLFGDRQQRQHPQDRDGRGDHNAWPRDRDDGSNINVKPDRRYFNPKSNFPSNEEKAAYNEGYAKGYDQAFISTYRQIYPREYREAYFGAERAGCMEARHRDYRPDYNDAFADGRRRGYTDAYKPAYDQAYRAMYDTTFRSVSENTYNQSYDGYYQRHFEEARSAAYKARYQDLYNAYFQSAHDQKFSQVYPGYAKKAYQNGRDDEAADFAQRPVRLLEASVSETIENGLYEPGETLRVQLKMRNYSEVKLLGKDIRVVLQALDESSAVISIAEESLVKNLRPSSLTVVTEALEFRMNENAVNRTKRFRVTMFYQDRNVGTQTLEVMPKFMVNMSFAESPQLREGLESSLKIRVRNQSSAQTDAGLKVTFNSRPEILEITKGEVAVGVLAPGEERVIEFKAIARKHGAIIAVPMVFQAQGGGRRIGLIDEERSIPLVNDYRIEVSAKSQNLRSAGVTRVQYKITNIGSRLLLRGLQLKARITGDNASEFVVIGPNPQFLTPLMQGQSVSFVVPILAKSSNSGGTLELEVQEDGRAVVISQTEF